MTPAVAALWPSVTLRSIGDVERTVVVVHSSAWTSPTSWFSLPATRARCLVSAHRARGIPRRHDLAADPAAPDRTTSASSRARHARRPQPFAVVARGRQQPADEEAAQPPGRSSGSVPWSPSPARVPAPVRVVAGRSARRGDPALRRRPEARVARARRAADGSSRTRNVARLRRDRRRDILRALSDLRSDGDRQARPRGQRPRQHSSTSGVRVDGKLGPR